MSTVTNIILTFDILEDEEARMREVNHYFVANIEPGFGWPIHCQNPGEQDVLDNYIGGDKNTEAPIYIGAFNGLDNDEFLAHLRTRVAWEYPENVRCYREMQDEGAFKEVFHEPKPVSDDLDDAMADLITALDCLEKAQWAGDRGACGEHEAACPYCDAPESNWPGPARMHYSDCKPALLLRKYGREVKIEGDEATGAKEGKQSDGP